MPKAMRKSDADTATSSDNLEAVLTRWPTILEELSPKLGVQTEQQANQDELEPRYVRNVSQDVKEEALLAVKWAHGLITWP
jgi:hypothetical protein